MTNSLRDRFTLIPMDTGTRLNAFGRDVRAGLMSQPKTLPCCYLYDSEGSELFENICDLPEYYLPAAEREILVDRAGEIVAVSPAPVTLVELGSGNAAKTRILIERLLSSQKSLNYVPIDICRTVLEDSSLQLLKDFPSLTIVAVAAEYQDGLRYLNSDSGNARLILWLGSNVGNFDRVEAAAFLRRIGQTMSPRDRLLVGIDLRKEAAVLEHAYDDSSGVTAQFNLNLLARINRELGGRFDLAAFRHRAIYNNDKGRVEMYLDSSRNQQVRIDQLGINISFAAHEPIFTESSYKYSLTEIEGLAASSALTIEQQWLDRQRRFSINLLRQAD